MEVCPTVKTFFLTRISRRGVIGLDQRACVQFRASVHLHELYFSATAGLSCIRPLGTSVLHDRFLKDLAVWSLWWLSFDGTNEYHCWRIRPQNFSSTATVSSIL